MPKKSTKKIAVLVEKDYQDLEVWYPVIRLKEEGHQVVTVGVNQKDYTGKYGYPIVCDKKITEVRARDFDGVVIPGGWAPDFLRLSRKVLQFVADLDKSGKMVAAICHAGWVIASAGIVEDRQCTSYIAIKDDLVNAGGRWADQEVVVDNNLITSRTPADLPAFLKAILRFLES